MSAVMEDEVDHALEQSYRVDLVYQVNTTSDRSIYFSLQSLLGTEEQIMKFVDDRLGKSKLTDAERKEFKVDVYLL